MSNQLRLIIVKCEDTTLVFFTNFQELKDKLKIEFNTASYKELGTAIDNAQTEDDVDIALNQYLDCMSVEFHDITGQVQAITIF